jgi:subtilase family serine protease
VSRFLGGNVPLSRLRPLRRSAFVGAAAILVVGCGSAVALAAPTPGSGTVTIPQGTAVATLPKAVQLSATASGTQLQVSFVLKLRNRAELQARVTSGWTGGYLTTAQFADRYGQPQSVIDAIDNYLRGYGIHVTNYADRLNISTTGTAVQYQKALSIGLHDYRVKEAYANGTGRVHAARVYASAKDPKLPATRGGAALGAAVLAILGLSNYSPFVSHAMQALAKKSAAVTKNSGSLPAGALAPGDFARRYNLTGLTATGAAGQGRTIGIVTLAAFRPATAVKFWNSYLGLGVAPNRISVVSLDGGAPGPSEVDGTDETDLDVEQSGALAPKANIRVYEAPNSDPGFSDAFYRAASDNIADSVSVSWGESETYVRAAVATGQETPAYEAAFDQAFLEMGAQGQSVFAASGDSGAYDATADIGTTNLSIDTPADSPYLTSAGGTTLPGVQTYGVDGPDGNPTGSTESVRIPAEQAWGWGYLWPLYAALGLSSQADASFNVIGGTGGGYSVAEPRPSYQVGISSYGYRQFLEPTTEIEIAPGVVEPIDVRFHPLPRIAFGKQASGRGGPDLATNADPQTGYAIFDPELFADSGGFGVGGGTSFVAPQLSGASAVIASALGHRVGFWNPKIYAAARTSASPFTKLNATSLYAGVTYLWRTDATGVKKPLAGVFSNNNLYYTGDPGTYWNPATGLGTPNLTKLATALR